MVVYLDAYDAIGDGELHTVREWLIGGEFDKGYKSLKQVQVDYPHVESLDDSIDWAIVQSAFNDLEDKGEIIFEEGKTYVFTRAVIVEDKSFDAFMDGSTVKMAAGSSYNAFRITTNEMDELDYVNWTGGVFDGNSDEIDWPGSKNPNTEFVTYYEAGIDPGALDKGIDSDAWTYDDEISQNTLELWGQYSEYGNNGLLGIQNAAVVIVDGVTIKNSISDGVVLYNVAHGTIKNSEAFGGVPFNFGSVLDDYGRGVQSTYFKARQIPNDDFDGGTFVVDNVHTSGGSIAFAMSTEPNLDNLENSKIIVNNSSSHNANQDAVHIENSTYVEILDSKFTQDDPAYSNNIFIGNATKYAKIENVTMIGNNIDFREASSLISGEIIDSTIVNEFENSDFGVRNATLISGTTVEVVSETAVIAREVVDSQILGFGKFGVTGAQRIDNVVIDNSSNDSDGTALRNFKGDTISSTTIANVGMGVALREGEIKIVDTNFVNIGGNAIRVIGLESLTLESVNFEEFGIDPEKVEDTFAIYARSYWGSDIILISDTTNFSSTDQNPNFSNSTGLQSIEYYPLNREEYTYVELIKLIDRDGKEIYKQGSEDNDRLIGGDGVDVILGGNGDDHISSGLYDDFLMGEAGDDLLDGQKGNDVLVGGEGNDNLVGGAGKDILYGEGGDDVLHGSGEGDQLVGGAGSDVFIFGSEVVSKSDRILDFKIDEGDVIDIGVALSGYSDSKDSIDDFVRLTSGKDAFSLWIDVDGGNVEQDFVKIIVLKSIEYDISLDILLESGNLIWS